MNWLRVQMTIVCLAIAACVTGCGNRDVKETVLHSWTCTSTDGQYHVDYRLYTSELGDSKRTSHGFDIRSKTGRQRGYVAFGTELSDIPESAVDNTAITWTDDGRSVSISIGTRRYAIDLMTGKHTKLEPQQPNP